MIHRWDLISSQYPGFKVVLTRKPDPQRPWKLIPDIYKFCVKFFPDSIRISNHIAFSPGLLHFVSDNKHGSKSIHIFEDVSGLNAFLIRIFNYKDDFYLMNDGGFVSTTKRLSQFIRWNFIGKKCKATMSPGNFGKKYMLAWGFSEDKIFNSYLSPDVEYFKRYLQSGECQVDRESIRQDLNINENDIVLFTNSRLLDWKRLIDFYDALLLLDSSTLSKICVILLGDGPDKVTLDKFKSQNLFRFYWLGQVDYECVLKYYSVSDILIHPSIGDIWGLVINESLLLGKPVICTNVIGAADLISHGFNGFKISEKSPQELSFYIYKVVNDNELLKTLSLNAFSISTTWNSYRFLNEFNNMITKNNK
jgi:glycosyltransferase involved in cell wall biosynthesis